MLSSILFASPDICSDTLTPLIPEPDIAALKARYLGRCFRGIPMQPWFPIPTEIPVSVQHTSTSISPFTLLVDVDLPSVGLQTLHILVDTGAQLNLVDASLFPPDIFIPSHKHFSLSSVDGTRVQGGTKTVTLSLAFRTLAGSLTIPTTFYDTPSLFPHHAILSFPWLVLNKIVIDTTHRSLCTQTVPPHVIISAECVEVPFHPYSPHSVKPCFTVDCASDSESDHERPSPRHLDSLDAPEDGREPLLTEVLHPYTSSSSFSPFPHDDIHGLNHHTSSLFVSNGTISYLISTDMITMESPEVE
jgi:hypothetical protein